MIEAIFWDSDGVLVDTEGLYFLANRDILAGFGIDLDHDLFAEFSLRRGHSLLDLVEGLDAEAKEALRLRRNRRYEDLLAEGIAVFDGVEECLSSLHGRVPMAVVSSANPDHFDTIHAQSGLLRFFEFTLRSGDYGRHKPHPEPYLTAAQRLDVDPARCLVVEDSERGLQAAINAGMRCVAIPNRLAASADFEGAFAVLERVDEVLEVLEALLPR